MDTAGMNALTNFLVDSIVAEPTPQNVAAIFRTVRALQGYSRGEETISKVVVAIANGTCVEALRAVRVGEFEREKTVYVQRPSWLITRHG